MKTDINILEIKNLNPTIKAFLNNNKAVVKLNDGFIFRNPFFYDETFVNFLKFFQYIDGLEFLLKIKLPQIKVNNDTLLTSDGIYFYASSLGFSLEQQVILEQFSSFDFKDDLNKNAQLIIVDNDNNKYSISLEQLETLKLNKNSLSLLEEHGRQNDVKTTQIVRTLLESIIYKDKNSDSANINDNTIYQIDFFEDIFVNSKQIDLNDREQFVLDLSINDVCDENNIGSSYNHIPVSNQDNIIRKFSNIVQKEVKREAMRKIFSHIVINIKNYELNGYELIKSYDESLLSLSSLAVVDFFAEMFHIKKQDVLFDNKLIPIVEKYQNECQEFITKLDYDYKNKDIKLKLLLIEKLAKFKSELIANIVSEFRKIDIDVNDKFTKMFVNLIKNYASYHIRFYANDSYHYIQICEYNDELNNNFSDLYSLISELMSDDRKNMYDGLKEYGIIINEVFNLI